MLETIRNAWKIPDLRKKILYTIFLLIIFRLGSVIPVPWLDPEVVSTWMSGENGSTLFNLLDMFSGGSLANATIFAMSITPYINSSIIMQLLCVAIPALERMSKEGEEGRKKITKITRYVTVALAALQAWGLTLTLKNQGALMTSEAGLPTWLVMVTVIFAFTAGTAFLMWLGEEITGKGIGNGISMLIFAGIVSRIPTMMVSAWNTFMSGGNNQWYALILLVIYVLASIAFVVLINEAERRIPVQYAKRVVGRKMYGGQSTFIPIKVAMAGVIPIIFAMSIMTFPATIATLFGKQTGVLVSVARFITGGGGIISQIFYPLVYFLLIVGFTYFYTSITFNPIEVSNNIKKNNGMIPGLRPGKPTSDYIAKVLGRITLVGAIFLGIVAVLPIIISECIPGLGSLSSIALTGTSLLIVVGVALETVKQIESQMLMRHYKGFLE